MRIEFSVMYEPSSAEFYQLLLHEMCHIYVYMFDYIDGSQLEHGPEFEEIRKKN